MVKQLTILTFGLALVAACGETPADPLNQRDGLMAAGQALVDICHVKGNGDVVEMTVPTPAVPGHLKHGDWLVTSKKKKHGVACGHAPPEHDTGDEKEKADKEMTP